MRGERENKPHEHHRHPVSCDKPTNVLPPHTPPASPWGLQTQFQIQSWAPIPKGLGMSLSLPGPSANVQPTAAAPTAVIPAWPLHFCTSWGDHGL